MIIIRQIIKGFYLLIVTMITIPGMVTILIILPLTIPIVQIPMR